MKLIIGTILTIAVCDTVPPGPVTVIVYIVLVDGETTIEPFRAVLPIAGLKLTEVAFVEAHVRVLDPP